MILDEKEVWTQWRKNNYSFQKLTTSEIASNEEVKNRRKEMKSEISDQLLALERLQIEAKKSTMILLCSLFWKNAEARKLLSEFLFLFDRYVYYYEAISSNWGEFPAIKETSSNSIKEIGLNNGEMASLRCYCLRNEMNILYQKMKENSKGWLKKNSEEYEKYWKENW